MSSEYPQLESDRLIIYILLGQRILFENRKRESRGALSSRETEAAHPLDASICRCSSIFHERLLKT